MNRFARIMQGVGWLGAALWLATWAQGYSVEGHDAALAWHTITALSAAAVTLLSRVWTLVFLELASPASGDSGHRAARRSARIASLVSLVFLGAIFALSGQVLWRWVTPLLHAVLGAGLIAFHVAALRFERRALAAS